MAIAQKFDEDRMCSSEDMIADRQTHTDRQTCSSQYSASCISYNIILTMDTILTFK